MPAQGLQVKVLTPCIFKLLPGCRNCLLIITEVSYYTTRLTKQWSGWCIILTNRNSGLVQVFQSRGRYQVSDMLSRFPWPQRTTQCFSCTCSSTWRTSFQRRACLLIRWLPLILQNVIIDTQLWRMYGMWFSNNDILQGNRNLTMESLRTGVARFLQVGRSYFFSILLFNLHIHFTFTFPLKGKSKYYLALFDQFLTW